MFNFILLKTFAMNNRMPSGEDAHPIQISNAQKLFPFHCESSLRNKEGARVQPFSALPLGDIFQVFVQQKRSRTLQVKTMLLQLVTLSSCAVHEESTDIFKRNSNPRFPRRGAPATKVEGLQLLF